jgi:hypothetical protein
MRRCLLAAVALLIGASVLSTAAHSVTLGGRRDSLKFAVIGDNGTGSREQYDVGRRMAEWHDRFPFELVLMMGDNLYGSQAPNDFVVKFERPYEALLKAGVKFYAALGNHDTPTADQEYPPFNMNGARYYSYTRKNVRFVVASTRRSSSGSRPRSGAPASSGKLSTFTTRYIRTAIAMAPASSCVCGLSRCSSPPVWTWSCRATITCTNGSNRRKGSRTS